MRWPLGCGLSASGAGEGVVSGPSGLGGIVVIGGRPWGRAAGEHTGRDGAPGIAGSGEAGRLSGGSAGGGSGDQSFFLAGVTFFRALPVRWARLAGETPTGSSFEYLLTRICCPMVKRPLTVE
jgi:hypothetical protein